MTRKRWLVLGTLLGALLLFVFLWPWNSIGVDRHETSGWGRRGEVLLRETSDGSGDFLVLRLSDTEGMYRTRDMPVPPEHVTNPKVVYRFLVSTSSLIEVPLGDWERQTTLIVSESNQQRALVRKWGVDAENHKLLYEDKIVSLRGGNFLQSVVRPGDRVAAVLSANGFFIENPIPLGATRRAMGRRYNQFVRLSDGEVVGHTYFLKGVSVGMYVKPAWTPDGRYLIYYDLHLNYLWVIPGFSAEDGQSQ